MKEEIKEALKEMLRSGELEINVSIEQKEVYVSIYIDGDVFPMKNGSVNL